MNSDNIGVKQKYAWVDSRSEIEGPYDLGGWIIWETRPKFIGQTALRGERCLIIRKNARTLML